MEGDGFKNRPWAGGEASFGLPLYRFPSFDVGTCPTLLDATEAKKVKAFIENWVFGCKYQITWGEVDDPSIFFDFSHQGMMVVDLRIPTALVYDLDPKLNETCDGLKLNGRKIIRNKYGDYDFFDETGTGFNIGAEGNAASVLLHGGDGTYSGFRDGGAGVVWILPDQDGTDGQVIKTNGAGTLSWVDNSGGGGGSGTVTSVATSNGTFVNVTGGTITTSGTISADLSATGSPSSSKFLRGDNTWAVPSGMTSFTISDELGNSFLVENGETVDFISSDGSVGIDCSSDRTIDLTGGGGGGGSGVTSVATSSSNTQGLTLTGGTITSTGTITLGGTVQIDLGDGSGSSSSQVTGILDEQQGGTGTGGYTLGDILYASTVENLSKLAIGSAGQLLKVGPSSNPVWQDSTFAPNDAKYVTLSTDSDLSQERVLTAGSGISITDGGSTVTIAATGGGGGGGSGTVTSVATGTGLTGGTITTSGTISMANTAVTAGSYTNTNLTVDAQGRITAASNGTGGGGGGSYSFDCSDGSSSFTVSNSDTVTFSSSDFSVYIDCTTADTIDFTVFGDEFSDKRLKKNVKPLGSWLDKICELEPVSFDWNAEAKKEIKKEGSSIGLIAQETVKIAPEIVTEKKGYMAVDYQKIPTLLIECIKELKEEISSLKNRIEVLESRDLSSSSE